MIRLLSFAALEQQMNDSHSELENRNQQKELNALTTVAVGAVGGLIGSLVVLFLFNIIKKKYRSKDRTANDA